MGNRFFGIVGQLQRQWSKGVPSISRPFDHRFQYQVNLCFNWTIIIVVLVPVLSNSGYSVDEFAQIAIVQRYAI